MYKDKAKELLGIANLPANVVAAAIGVSPSLISQWLSEEEFSKDVQEMRTANLIEATGRDKKYNSIEDSLLGRLTEMLESRMHFTTPRDILSAIRIINSAVRRGSPAELTGAAAGANIVSLQLPENVEFAARFVVNGKNQVVEIAGRPIATMPAKGVVAQLEKMQKSEKENAEAHRQDKESAVKTLDKLVTLSHLPVANVL